MAKAKSKLDRDIIVELAGILDETGLSEIEIEQEGMRVRVARQTSFATAAPVEPTPVEAEPAHREPTAASGDVEGEAVTSPMVGTVYLAPAPDARPFVSPGDRVEKGQPLLIIEAMKTMNQIPAPRAGTVKAVLVANEQPVEFGEPLVVLA